MIRIFFMLNICSVSQKKCVVFFARIESIKLFRLRV